MPSSSDSGSGETTFLGGSSSFAYSDDTSGTYYYGISGPPASTVTHVATSSETDTGGGEGAYTETLTAGHADTAGGAAAGQLGSFPGGPTGPGGAVHDGTTQPVLDTSQGLVSALGGQDVHGLGFVGARQQSRLTRAQGGERRGSELLQKLAPSSVRVGCAIIDHRRSSSRAA